MTRQLVRSMVVDVDDTLFDWFGMWHASASALLEVLTDATGWDHLAACKRLRPVYQRTRTNEYVPTAGDLVDLRLEGDVNAIAESISVAWRCAKNEAMQVFPGVRRALTRLRDGGVSLVAHTDAPVEVATARLEDLGLWEFFEHLYCTGTAMAGEALGEGVTVLATRKPDPAALQRILSDLDVPPDQCAYLGDSLARDIQMAQACRVLDLHARYGSRHASAEYALLQALSHWTDIDVDRERQLLRDPDLKATVELRAGIEEVFDHIKF